ARDGRRRQGRRAARVHPLPDVRPPRARRSGRRPRAHFARPTALRGEAAAEPSPMKIISLIPSATEIVYALGLGEDLEGVTEECDFPADATTKPVVSR